MARKGYRTVSIAYKFVDGRQLAAQSTQYNRTKDVLEEI